MEIIPAPARRAVFSGARILTGRRDAGRRLTSTVGTSMKLLHGDLDSYGVYEALRRRKDASIRRLHAAIRDLADMSMEYLLKDSKPVENETPEEYRVRTNKLKIMLIRTNKKRRIIHLVMQLLNQPYLIDPDFARVCEHTDGEKAMQTAKVLYTYANGVCSRSNQAPPSVFPSALRGMEADEFLASDTAEMETEIKRIQQKVALSRLAFGYFLECDCALDTLDARDPRSWPNVAAKRKKTYTRHTARGSNGLADQCGKMDQVCDVERVDQPSTGTEAVESAKSVEPEGTEEPVEASEPVGEGSKPDKSSSAPGRRGRGGKRRERPSRTKASNGKKGGEEAMDPSRYTEHGEIIMTEDEKKVLARVFDDSYKCSLFSDAHAAYILGPVRPVEGAVSKAELSHVNFGEPCLSITNSLSSLPDLVDSFSRQWFSTHASGAVGKTALFGSLTTVDAVDSAESVSILNGSSSLIHSTAQALSKPAPQRAKATAAGSSSEGENAAAKGRKSDKHQDRAARANKLALVSQRNLSNAVAQASKSTKQTKSVKNAESSQRATLCSRSTAIIVGTAENGPPSVEHQLNVAPMTAIYANEARKELTTLLIRATMASSRGWEASAVALIKSYELVRCVMCDILKMALTGMHPNLHPSLRPSWTRRTEICHAVDQCMKARADLVITKAHSAVKEAIRIVISAYIAEMPSVLAACTESGNCLSALTSVPFAFPVASAMAAAQHLVMTGQRLASIACVKSHTLDSSLLAGLLELVCTAENRKKGGSKSSAAGGKQGAPRGVSGGAATGEGAVDADMEDQEDAQEDDEEEEDEKEEEPEQPPTLHNKEAVADNSSGSGDVGDVGERSAPPPEGGGGADRSSSSYGARAMGETGESSKPTKKGTTHKKIRWSIVYSGGWFSRASGNTRAEDVAAPVIVERALQLAFSSKYIPFWLQAHTKNIRVSHLDLVLQHAMHKSSSIHTITSMLSDEAALRVQHAALKTPNASLLTLSEVASLVGVVPEVALSLRAKGSIASVTQELSQRLVQLPPIYGASIILFSKIAAIKEKLLSVSLGKRVMVRQFAALRRRYGMNQARMSEPLPHYATNMYICLDCSRVANSTVELNCKPTSCDSVGISSAMRQSSSGPSKEDEYLCSKRSSAATKQAGHKDLDADQSSFFELDDLNEHQVLRSAKCVRENQSIASQLRRDCSTCQSQESAITACGRPMIKVPILGRSIRVFGRWYCLCCYCGILHVSDQRRKYNGLPCCGHCDASIMGVSHGNAEASYVHGRLVRQHCSVFGGSNVHRHSAEIPTISLGCRFCGKRREGPQAAKFQIVEAPMDDGGRNGHLPPPLRLATYCPSHARPWVAQAHRELPTSVVFAHISERCAPVFGADTGRRGMEVEFNDEIKAKRKRVSSLEMKIRKRVAGAR